MISFERPLRTCIIFGVGKLDVLGKEAAKLGRKAMLVTGRSAMRKLGILDRAKDRLIEEGLEVVVFDRAEPNPRISTVDEGAKVAREEGINLIVGLGGGSAIDLAKGISLCALAGKPVWNYVEGGSDFKREPHDSSLPLIAVPTLAAAGSEFGDGAVLTNWETHEKVVLAGSHLFPHTLIVDPELTVSAPRDLTGDGGIDIIAHATDNYISNTTSTPVQDHFSESIMRVVIEYLPRALENGEDLEARTHLLWASTLANSWVISSGRNGAGPVHFIEHCLSGYYDISHGRGMAVIMPVLWRYNCEVAPEKYVQIARNVFGIIGTGLSDRQIGMQGIGAFEAWMKENGLFYRLSDLGIDDTHFEDIARDSVRIYESMGGEDGSLRNPRRLGVQEIIEVLRRAM